MELKTPSVISIVELPLHCMYLLAKKIPVPLLLFMNTAMMLIMVRPWFVMWGAVLLHVFGMVWLYVWPPKHHVHMSESRLRLDRRLNPTVAA